MPSIRRNDAWSVLNDTSARKFRRGSSAGSAGSGSRRSSQVDKHNKSSPSKAKLQGETGSSGISGGDKQAHDDDVNHIASVLFGEAPDEEELNEAQ